MPQIFHRSSNSLARLSIFGAIILVAIIVGVLCDANRSPYITQAGVIRDQPVPFSHQHHVQGLGIDCRYCHTSVENSSFAGIPPTKTCMTCHSQIWSDSPTLEPVRESFRTGKPLAWTRVHDLPDFVYFNHSIHVAKGIACATCHGPVETMPLTWRQESLNMEWCLKCHRDPSAYVTPKEAEFLPAADGRRMLAELAGGDDAKSLRQARMKLAEAYHLQRKTDCSVCHR
jgi:hypothetical protein